MMKLQNQNVQTNSEPKSGRYLLSYREQRYAAVRQIIPDIRVRFRSKVDPDCLRDAVKAALDVHPLFRTRLVRDGGLYCLVPNEAEPVILEERWETPTVFGTAETGFFPWAITYSDDVMLFTASHALSDASGFMAFLKTVLVLYLRERGVIFPERVINDATERKTDHDERDPYLLFASLPADPPGLPRFAPASSLPDDIFETDARKVSTYKVTFDLDEVKKAAGESETSQFSVMACLLARAAENAFEMNEGSIEVRVPVDLRTRFSFATERNFVYGFSLHYDVKKMKNLPNDRVETAFRSQLDLYTDKDNLIGKMKREREKHDDLLRHPERLDAMPLESETVIKPTAKIAYTHVTHTGFADELENELFEFENVGCRRADRHLLFTAMTRQSKIEFAVQQSTKGNRLIHALEEEAAKRGFICLVEKKRTRPYAVYRPEGLEK